MMNFYGNEAHSFTTLNGGVNVVDCRPGFCDESYLARIFLLDDDLREAVERAALAAFVGFVAAWVAVPDTDDFLEHGLIELSVCCVSSYSN